MSRIFLLCTGKLEILQLIISTLPTVCETVKKTRWMLRMHKGHRLRVCFMLWWLRSIGNCSNVTTDSISVLFFYMFLCSLLICCFCAVIFVCCWSHHVQYQKDDGISSSDVCWWVTAIKYKIAIFTGKPRVVVDCPINFLSPFVSSLCVSSVPFHHVFLERPVLLRCCLMFDPVSIIFTLSMSKPSES